MRRPRRLVSLFLGMCLTGLMASGEESRGPSVMAFPYGYYEPVTGLSVGGSLLDFNALRTGVTLDLDATYSFAGFFATQATIFAPYLIPRTSLSLRMGYSDYAQRFFGFGDSTSLDSAFIYSNSTFQVEAKGSISLGSDWRLNPSIFLDTALIGPYQGQVLPKMTGSDGGFMTLARMEIAHDRRASIDTYQHKDYVAFGCSISQPALGSSFPFELLDLDLRYFLNMPGGQVLAARVAAKQCIGDAPFNARPDFGGTTSGRGFQPDRFIGNAGAYGQLEYRFPILSKIGGDFFLDLGQVGDGYPSFTLNGLHFCGGAGLRFISPKLPILSIDVGFNGEPLSREGFAIIIRTGQAF